MKKCPSCKGMHDGPTTSCEQCKEYARQYYRDNKERMRAQAKAYYYKFKDRDRPVKKAWNEANKERRRELNRQWYLDNKERVKSQQREKSYGITRDQYLEMVASQNGLCAICEEPPGKRELDVDHNHTTGRVRSLLCIGCNTSIGLSKESPERLRKMADYLEHHNSLDSATSSANLSQS